MIVGRAIRVADRWWIWFRGRFLAGSVSGYWYTPYGKEREWREAPRCSDCGTAFKQTQVRSMESAHDSEVLAVVFCPACPRRIVNILKPSQAAIERGRELAERYGW